MSSVNKESVAWVNEMLSKREENVSVEEHASTLVLQVVLLRCIK